MKKQERAAHNMVEAIDLVACGAAKKIVPMVVKGIGIKFKDKVTEKAFTKELLILAYCAQIDGVAQLFINTDQDRKQLSKLSRASVLRLQGK